MQDNKKQRIALGTTCIIIAALVMGWFVGQYIPGMPREPEPPIGQGLLETTGYPTNEVVDFKTGSAMQLRSITKGAAYDYYAPELNGSPSDKLVDRLKARGEWEYDSPNIDIQAASIKIISAKSFAEWYPEYRSQWEGIYDDSSILAVTATITNVSSEPITNWNKLPDFTLWSANLNHIGDSLGSGAFLDSAFYLVNDSLT